MADIATQAFMYAGKPLAQRQVEYATRVCANVGHTLDIVLPPKEEVKSGTAYGYYSNTTGTLVSANGQSESWS